MLLTAAFALGLSYTAAKADEAPTGPVINLKTNYFWFGGTNGAQLRAAMSAARPWRFTQDYDARTKWDLETAYRIRMSGKQFVISDWSVRAEVEVTLPFWLPRKPVSRELTQRWEKCLAGLQAHEQGHVELAKSAANLLFERWVRLTPSNSHEELEAAVGQARQKTLDEIHERERQYDEETRHGATQGAVFTMEEMQTRWLRN